MPNENNDWDESEKDLYVWLIGKEPEMPTKPKKLFSTREEESHQPKPLPIRKLKFDALGNELEDDGYRNPGGGSGRPLSTNRASKFLSIRATPDQHKQFLALGGCKWIKTIIDETSQ